MKIAIDGPAGAGKSTVARALAQQLGCIYIDTGAMYRALTWKALCRGIDLQDAASLKEMAIAIDIHFDTQAGKQRIICDGEDLTEVIRSPQINAAVSVVAAPAGVREVMVRKQQEMARTNSVVMDGRDIGELVMPNADYKFFLTADLQERTQRRSRDMERLGFDQDLMSMQKDIESRDQMDSQRKVGALKILPDSIVIDTSQSTSEEVLSQILSIIGEG
jgi:CMP/dCMP kinase